MPTYQGKSFQNHLDDTQKRYYSANVYRFLSLDDIINNFIVSYVGEDKIIPKVRRVDVSFHAIRALQELSYDTLTSILSQELEVPSSLKLPLPYNYVNYVKFTWSDNSGIEHIIYPAIKTSNPLDFSQNDDGTLEDSESPTYDNSSDTLDKYSSSSPAENQKDDYNLDSDTFDLNLGQRYGIDPRHAQVNGSFFIDEFNGFVHFSSNLSGKTVIIKYISDGLANSPSGDLDLLNGSINIHKFAEEAMYKQIAYALLSTRINTPPHLIQMYKKEAFAAKRNAKLRLSNIKIEEIAQIMRGKSKHIKH